MQTIITLHQMSAGITRLRHLAEGGKGMRLALLDTGIDCEHPAFNGRSIIYKDCCAHRVQPVDADGHGTHCAGVILDMVPNCTLLVGRVMERNGNFSYDALLDGLLWSKQQAAEVVCICSGTRNPDPDVDRLIQAMSNHTTFVAAVGNNGSIGRDAGYYPARHPEVLAVGSADEAGIMPFVDRPEDCELFCVGGGLTIGPWPGGSARSMAGTSVSACQMAGIVTLIRKTGKHLPGSIAAHLRKSMKGKQVGTTMAYFADAGTEF